ncbi:hypothetical protein GE061_009985 [Apolygus lucorum]|uniref:Peptidase S1 domain-containing protein n=1 Tax=Apolygus lucorum TaxID=248454 RepID=A0A8S9Y223_APOLU|nr:hypothetical protein GE061_009985 [Apolygus lucorum]
MTVINLVTLLLALPFVVNSKTAKGHFLHEYLSKYRNATRQVIAPQYYWANGQIAIRNEFPFAATLGWPLQYSPGNFEVLTYNPFCGGSLITNFHILTSAQCVDAIYKQGYRENSIIAILGSYDRRIRMVDELRIPVKRLDPNPFYFGPPHLINDIALVTLSTGIASRPGVKPVCLPKPNYKAENKLVIQVGWETWVQKASPYQRKLITSSLSLISCQKYGPFTTGQLCTYSFVGDFCKGESGGGAVVIEKKMHVLAGVQSMVSCDKIRPIVNTAVHSYVEWIKRVVGGK